MSETILVVDDDPALVNLLKEDLEAEGYTIVTGYDGQMAVQAARTTRPDLIILDVHMPMTNGPKAYEVLRSAPETRMIPVIFLTGEPSQRVSSVDPGARMAHLQKPVDLEELNALVRQFLKPSPAS